MKRRMERRIFVVNFSADFVNLKNGSFPTGGLSQNEKKVRERERERERKSILVIAASVRLSLPSLAVSLSISTSATFSSMSDPLSLFLSLLFFWKQIIFLYLKTTYFPLKQNNATRRANISLNNITSLAEHTWWQPTSYYHLSHLSSITLSFISHLGYNDFSLIIALSIPTLFLLESFLYCCLLLSIS